jgi:DNA-binding LacI/PurR family transcriptional regulator
MGIEVLKLMADMLKNEKTTKKKILIPVELVERNSVCELKIK